MEAKNKQLYVAPAAETVELKPQGVLCNSPYNFLSTGGLEVTLNPYSSNSADDEIW